VLSGAASFRRAAASRWLLVCVAGAVLAAAGASVAVALGGDRTPAVPGPAVAGPVAHVQAVPMPVQCASWGCTRARTVDLGAGYAVTLWHAGKAGNYRAEPVVELTHDGISAQWWLWPHGYGWDAAIQCSVRAPEPNCMLTDGDGAHSAAAQLIILRRGRLDAPARASVIADLPTVAVRDLDGDGYLDLVAVDSDYTPNFAQGHLYWNTFRFVGGQLASTGCASKTSPTEPAPAHPLNGVCPKR
jgi:hypothetical protein